MRVGDLVLVVENDAARGKWKLAGVENIFPGNDNRVRVAEVRMASGTYTRPVTNLCFLEEASK